MGTFLKQEMAAILYFNAKNRSNHSEIIATEFLDPENPIIHILVNPVAKIIPKLNFQDGRWRPFWNLVPKKFARIFERYNKSVKEYLFKHGMQWAISALIVLNGLNSLLIKS